MSKLHRLTPDEAEGILLKAGFELIRSRGSHRIDIKGRGRIMIPFHCKILHPRIVKQVLKAIEPAE